MRYLSSTTCRYVVAIVVRKPSRCTALTSTHPGGRRTRTRTSNFPSAVTGAFVATVSPSIVSVTPPIARAGQKLKSEYLHVVVRHRAHEYRRLSQWRNGRRSTARDVGHKSPAIEDQAAHTPLSAAPRYCRPAPTRRRSPSVSSSRTLFATVSGRFSTVPYTLFDISAGCRQRPHGVISVNIRNPPIVHEQHGTRGAHGLVLQTGERARRAAG